jgi:hypothetical protein
MLAAGVKAVLDLILIFENAQDHLALLGKVLNQLSKAGLKIKKDNCTFAQLSAEFLECKIILQRISIS